MREQNLLGGKSARIVFIDCGARAEERHLETERVASAGIEPSGDVPPLGAKFGMRAMVGGKTHRHARAHLGIKRERGTIGRYGSGREREGNGSNQDSRK